MTQTTWIEVRLLVPARMQEEAGLFLTEFSGRGVIFEDDPGGDGVEVLPPFSGPRNSAPGSKMSCKAIYLA